MEVKNLIKYFNSIHSCYHCVKTTEEVLLENGFKKLCLESNFSLKKDTKYYVIKGDSTICAFTIGKNLDLSKGFRIYAAHTDSPTLRIKPNPEVNNYDMTRLNVEVYGGPILSTWFDRELSIAGRVFLKGETFKPIKKLINIDKDLLVIPNLAIHQNREVNNGVKIDKQKDLLPVITTLENIKLIDIVAKELNVEVSDILDYDLYLYSREESKVVGYDDSMFLSHRIDNIASVYAGVMGLVSEKMNDEALNVFIAYDNEEIGSATKQGADSNSLINLLERITVSLGYTRSDFLRVLNSSYIISADGGHASHPAFLNKSDITNYGQLNKGVLVKMSASYRYTSDAESIAVLKQLVEGRDVKLQYFVNNSNEIGGSTIGPISSTHLDILSIDLGIPLLAMHSTKELCGLKDIEYLINIARSLFGAK